MSGMQRRGIYVGLTVVTISLGLLEHRQAAALGHRLGDAAGDAMWASMIVWIISAIVPFAGRPFRFGIAYAICLSVELSQAVHGPTLDALRANRFAQLVLGSGFDPRDFLWYAIGIAV